MREWFNIYLNDSDKELLKQTLKMRTDSLTVLIETALDNQNKIYETYMVEKAQLSNLYLRIQNIKDQGQYKED